VTKFNSMNASAAYNSSVVSEPHLGSGDVNAMLWEAAERAQNDRVYQVCACCY